MDLGWEVPRELLARQVNRPALFRSTEGMVRVDDRPTTSSDLNKHKVRSARHRKEIIKNFMLNGFMTLLQI